MVSLLDDINRAARHRPAKPAVGLQVGTLTGVVDGRTQVEVLGSEPVTLPALPGNYVVGGRVNVQWDTTTDRPLLVYGPAEGGDPTDGREMVTVGGDLAGDREAREAVDEARREIDRARTDLDTTGALIDGLRERVGRKAWVAEGTVRGLMWQENGTWAPADAFRWEKLGHGRVRLTVLPDLTGNLSVVWRGITAPAEMSVEWAPGQPGTYLVSLDVYDIDADGPILTTEPVGITLTDADMGDPADPEFGWQDMTLPLDQLTAPGGVLDPDALAALWDQVVVGGFLVATEGIIGPKAIIDGGVQARHLDVVTEAKDGTSWRLDENGFVALRADSSAAMHLNEAGLRLWGPTGTLTARLDGVNNMLTGRFQTGATGQPGVSIVPNTGTQFQDAGVWISGAVSGTPAGTDAGVWITAPAAPGAKPLYLRGQNGGGVEVRGGLTSTSTVSVQGAIHYDGTLRATAGDRHSLEDKPTYLRAGVSPISGGRNAVFANTDGRIEVQSSSIRYKVNRDPMTLDYARRLLEVETFTYYSRQDADGLAELLSREAAGETVTEEEWRSVEYLRPFPGVSAESVAAAGLDEFVFYNVDPTDPDNTARWVVDGVRYGEMTAPLIVIARDHDTRIADLEARLAALEGPTT